ncbi:MAG: hypothetical protein IKP65_03240 [Alphaproteobacteria bacterium]|nr:hypothetical protein [Alphaproteobacteria bacterium]
MNKFIYIFIYFFLIAIIFGFSIRFLKNDEKKDLLEYKVIDVIKEDNHMKLIAEINQHYYVLNKSFDNVIFKHYKECPFCRKEFKPFVFSIYDGYNMKLQEKFNKGVNHVSIQSL